MGAHVRDAAAYVCWAFARAYEKEAMAEAARQLAPALLAVACYDREVCPLNSLTSSVTRNNCGKLILLGSIQCFMMVYTLRVCTVAGESGFLQRETISTLHPRPAARAAEVQALLQSDD